MKLARTALVFFLIFGAAPAARAQQSVAGEFEEPEAERLFNEGRVLMGRGEYATACERFEASRKLKPRATGPLLNLALCKEALGDYFTASKLFEESIARDARPDRVAFAEKHLAATRPKIASLKLVVPSEIRGLEISLDGSELPANGWNVDLPLDGGPHEVKARAPGKRELVLRIDIAKDSGRGVLTVLLEDAPPVNPAGYWIGGAGIAITLVGVGFGTDVVIQCGGFFTRVCKGPNSAPTTQEREQKLRDVDTRAWVATIATSVGLAATAAGAYLLLTSKKASSTSPTISASITPVGPSLYGTF